MHPCPSCAAPLDEEGICTSCGALTRGFFRGLDLGAPQLAAAVANGLDFYLLLGVEPTADLRAIARRYRQLRVLFPDDPSDLAPEPARRLKLLELAGRALTDPRLRDTYDQLRPGEHAATTQVLRCAGCAAPLPIDAARCPFCGTPRPAVAQAPAEPPEGGPPPAEPVDYYAMLGITPTHLTPAVAPVPSGTGRASLLDVLVLYEQGREPNTTLRPQGGPPTPADVDAAALELQHKILLAPSYAPEEREARVDELEIARRILREGPLRSRYDMLLLGFRQGLYGGGRLEALRQLQELTRAELAESRGEQLSGAQVAALLKQGQGFLDARLPREAVEPLRRAVAALPESAEAHQAYARAILESDDPLALGGYALRQALKSLDALAALGATGGNQSALAALCRGLLARDEGNAETASAELQRAVEQDARLAPAWRGLAALSLSAGAVDAGVSYCRRALAIDARDERALLMLVAAYLRAGQRAPAREAAGQVAALRGEDWTADSVLRELGG